MLELPPQASQGQFALGHQHYPGGVAVEAMNDSRAKHLPAGGQVADVAPVDFQVIRQGVDQGAGPVAARRMHYEVGLLVDRNEIVVLVDHIERDVLGRDFLGSIVGESHVDDVAGLDGVAALDGLPVNGNVAVVNVALKGRARSAFAQSPREILIEAALGKVAAYLDANVPHLLPVTLG